MILIRTDRAMVLLARRPAKRGNLKHWTEKCEAVFGTNPMRLKRPKNAGLIRHQRPVFWSMTPKSCRLFGWDHAAIIL
jgi:hypothetical protein